MFRLNGYSATQICVTLLILSMKSQRVCMKSTLCTPCTCRNLTADCAGQNLPTIPTTIHSNITRLRFSKNAVSFLDHSQLSRFKNLTSLDLSRNKIFKINSTAFKGLRNLQVLYLDGNHLTYDDLTFTNSLFKPLQNLIELRINGSRLTSSSDYPDKSLEHLSSLETLFIDGLRNKSLGSGFEKLKKLKKIVFDGTIGPCHIINIYHETFRYLKNIENFSINYCNLSYIQPGSFGHMKRLTVLDLSHNECLGMDGVADATEGLSSSTFQSLYANQVVGKFPLFVIVPDRFAFNLQNTSLTEIQLNDNKIVTFGNNALRLFPKTLSHIMIQDNELKIAPYLFDVPSLSGLKELDLSGKNGKTVSNIPTKQSNIFIDCPHKDNPKNECSDVESNMIYQWPYTFEKLPDVSNDHEYYTFGLPPIVTKVKYSGARIYLHLTELHVINNSITYIDLSDNMITSWRGPVYGFYQLKHLDLSTNRAGHVSQEFFDHLPELMFLNISYNYIGESIHNDTKGRIFKNLINLQILDLTENLIKLLPSEIFSGLTSLQKLYIGRNGISIFPDDISHMIKLVYIDLKFNQIRWLTRSFTKHLDEIAEKHKVIIDVSENSIDCTCENLHFLSWLVKTNVKHGNLSHYRCVYESGFTRYFTDIDDIKEEYLSLDTFCHYFSLVIGMTVTVLLSLTLIIAGVVHRYRWKLRYWYFAAKHRYHQSKNYQTFSNFTFDAFVSYAEGDRNFIVNEMISRLEEEGDLTLNIHQRDFTPGRSIAENVIEAIQKSRRTLCILSKDFLESYWCIYELQMANMESVTTGRDVLLIVMMEHIPTRNIPSEILYHIQTDSYIQYPAEGNTDMFWRNLIDALKD